MAKKLSTPAGRSLLELRYGIREIIADFDAQQGRSPIATHPQQDEILAEMEEIRERVMLEAMETRSPRNLRLAGARKARAQKGKQGPAVANKARDQKNKKKSGVSGNLKKLIHNPYAYFANSKNSWLKPVRHLFPK